MPNNTTVARSIVRPVRGKPRARERAGFTLLDLVAALAIAGLLASVAVPSYRAQLTRARRTDARAALLEFAAAEEVFHASCNSYAAVLDTSRESSCEASSLKFDAIAGPGSYSLEVSSADAAAWTATATAAVGGPQGRDHRCRVLGLTSTGRRSATMADGTPNAEECWTR